MTRKWYRKIILSGILVVLIFIRHTVVGTYENDDGPKWSFGINEQHREQSIHQHHSRTAQHELALPHRYRHHHHDDYMQHKSNREMHIKSQNSHFYRDRDYRPATKATTRTPTTLSWKLSSATAANQRFPELTHITYQGGNETKARSTAPVKNRLDDGERHQQWSVNNKRFFIGSFQVKLNNDDAPTSTLKTEDNLRTSWPYFKSNSRVVQHEESHLQVEDTHNGLLGKTSTIEAVDPRQISNEDQQFKSKADYSEDYDGVDYYEDVDGNEEGLPGNKIEQHNNRQQEDDEADVNEVSEYKIEEKSSLQENRKNEEEDENKSRDKNGQQEVDDDYSSEYLDDDPDLLSGDQNETISLTERKWNNYGTPVAVARSRQQYMMNSPQNKVDAHIQRLKEEGKCRWPHPKVIPLIDASNRFIPHCTILHRCGDDTGCCDDDKKKCVAKRTTSMDLHFYVIPLDNHSKPSIEVRKFENHTECHCVDKNRHRRNLRHNIATVPNSFDANGSCKCPSLFSIVVERGECRCDCSKWNQGCNFLKEGKDGFPNEDQICISQNICQKPTCEFGSYNKHSGRCPRLRTHIPQNHFR